MQEELNKIASDVYYLNSEMIKFLLIENLALKNLLYEKGIIDADEYRAHQQKAASILEEKTKDKIFEKFSEFLKDQINHL